MWPTPRAQEPGRTTEGFGRGLAELIEGKAQVKMWPTSHLAKETNAPSEANRNEPSISSMVGGSLNPQFVEWLMGYPRDWTVVEDFASGRQKTTTHRESAQGSNIAPTA